MKKYILVGLLAVVPLLSFAYTPTEEDRDWLRAADDQMEDMFPAQVEQLIAMYDNLSHKKVELRVMYGERGLYLWKEMRDELHHQLFRQSDVCIPQHAQWGDSVEVRYEIHTKAGDLVRTRTKPLAFNPGKEQVRYSLEATVLGMQVSEQLYRPIKTVGVIADTAGNETRTLHPSDVDIPMLDLEIGKQYAFGVNGYDRVVLGKITQLDTDIVTFDFAEANNTDHVYITVSLDRLRKACQ